MRKINESEQKFVESEKVTLRHFLISDLDDFYEYASDYETVMYLSWPAHKNISQSEEILKKYYVGNENCFAILDSTNKKCIGSFTFVPDYDEECVSFGIVINKKYWNKGIGTETLRQAIDFAFSTLKAKKVTCEHFVDNERSARMLRKAGLYYCGNGKSFAKETRVYMINSTEWKKENITKVLFVNPPTVTEIPKFARGISYYSWLKTKNKFYDFVPGELLGAQSIQSYVEENNFMCEFEILNACLEEHTSLEQTLEEIVSKMPLDLVCLTGPYDVFSEVLQIAREIKKQDPNVKILYGQFFASLCYSEILNKYDVFDYLSVGYGEITTLKLIECLQGSCTIGEVPGLAYRAEGKVIYNEPVNCNWSDIVKVKPTRYNIEKVIKSGLNVSLFCSRGCPYRCSFCASGSLMGNGQKHLLRDPYDVVDELEELYKKYHIKKITFVDDTFAANNQAGKMQARVIAEEIIRRKIDVEIMIDSRIDCVDKELFSLLYKAGVRYVYIGIEAASDSNLIEYNKGYKSSKISDSLNILEDIGIKAVYGFINFNPETTYEDLESNIDLLSTLKYSDPTLYSHEYIPYPGTAMTNRLLKEGLIVGNFPTYQIKYKNENIHKIKKDYDSLLAVYTMFLFNMNKYSSFYMAHHSEEVEAINKLFTEYFKELIQTAKESKDSSTLLTKYEKKLKEILKKILVEERNKGVL